MIGWTATATAATCPTATCNGSQTSMNDQYTRLPHFRLRLSETVAWCTSERLESDPVESEEVQERRRLGREAVKLTQRSFLSSGPKFWKSYLDHRARRLHARAKLHQIAPLAGQLRSSCLQPARFESGQSSAERAQIVETLSDKRAEQLRLGHFYPSPPLEGLAGGRLLLYSPDENLFDGAAQVSSKGFFDVDNIPPWDTWVCFFQRHLVSWVPPQLLELAGQGIDVNPEQCILWASDIGVPNASP
jgi:hypothetical protein